MAAQDVTTGSELLDYKGDADLAGGAAGEALGTAESSFTPLQTWAVYQYNTNKTNYETQEEDRKVLEKAYTDPNLNMPLDEDIAVQVQPQLDSLSELMKLNPQLYSDRKLYYKFIDTYKKASKDMAVAKTVQTLRDKYNNLKSLERNEKRKDNIAKYLDQLKNWKLGDEVPVYSEIFGFDATHLVPTLKSSTKQVVQEGNFIKEYQVDVRDVRDADKEQRKVAEKNGSVRESGTDFARGIYLHDNVDYYDSEMKKKAKESLDYNYKVLEAKYAEEFEKYKKNNPSRTIRDFLNATNRSAEVQELDNSLKFLTDGIHYVDVQPNEPRLFGFTYSEDGKKRLSVDDITLLSAVSAMETPVGVSRKLLKSEISKVPSDISLNKAKERESNAKTNKLNAQTQGIIQDNITPEFGGFMQNVNAFGSQISADDFFSKDPARVTKALTTNNYIKSNVPMVVMGDKGKVVEVKPIRTPIYGTKTIKVNGKDQQVPDYSNVTYKDDGKFNVEYRTPTGAAMKPNDITKLYNRLIQERAIVARKHKEPIPPAMTIPEFYDLAMQLGLMSIEFVGEEGRRVNYQGYQQAMRATDKQYKKKDSESISSEGGE